MPQSRSVFVDLLPFLKAWRALAVMQQHACGELYCNFQLSTSTATPSPRIVHPAGGPIDVRSATQSATQQHRVAASRVNEHTTSVCRCCVGDFACPFFFFNPEDR